MTITRINEFTAKDGKGDEMLAYLHSLVPYISGCDGCEFCEVMSATEDPNSFMILEKWTSIDAHKAALSGFPRDKMREGMALFGAAPKGTYYKDGV